MNLKTVKGDKWYRQGVEAVPWLITYGYHGAFNLFGEENCVMLNRGTHNYGFWRISAFRKKANEIIDKQIKDKKHVDSLIDEWKKRAAVVQKAIDDLENIKKLNDKELMKKIVDFYSKTNYLWSIAATIEFFDPLTDDVVQEVFDKYKSEISLDEFKELCLLEEPNIIQKEKLDLIEIKKKGCKDVEKHVEKYKHIKTNFFESKLLTKEEVLKELEDVKVDLSYYDKIKNRKKELLEKYDLCEEVMNVVYFFNRLIYWREIRKEMSMKINYFLGRMLEEVCVRLGKPQELIMWACISEAERLFDDDFFDELEKRKKYIASYKEGDKYIILGGDEALVYIKTFEETLKDINELKGVVACKGKVEGKVKILLRERDFEKFEEGDIIVALMTRPEYLPVMKKCAAIITEEGGITCHAAIVSRELGVPCLIGVQNALGILNDNDLVEVDAENGKVKKIN